jgi:putative transposase
MSKTRLLIKNVCYHIVARGNHKQNIFANKEDFHFYLQQLKHYKKKYPFLLYGYCLMPNHIHIIGEPKDPEELPKLMQSLHRSYTAYYNKKYNTVGHLWQGRFRTKVINKDEYLVGCIAYVEQNPVKANLTTSLNEYEFSSRQERCLDENVNIRILDKLLI